MIIVKIIGGLTSQMHKYSIGRALSLKYDVPLKLDLSWFDNDKKSDTSWLYQLDYYNIKAEIATDKEIRKLKGSDLFVKWTRRVKYYLGINIYKSSYLNTSFLPLEDFFKLKSNIYLEGEWSGAKYFEEFKSNIIEELTLKNNIKHSVQHIIDSLIDVNSVSLHIRRGDYISNKGAASFHSICSVEYYKKAIDYIKLNTFKPVFYIFSDDIEWAKENLRFDIEMVFIEDNENYEDLLIMSKCTHNIIANSGFSWWASWLNKNDKKIIIAPNEWVKDQELNLKILTFLESKTILFMEN